jgi:hypothetical protein
MDGQDIITNCKATVFCNKYVTAYKYQFSPKVIRQQTETDVRAICQPKKVSADGVDSEVHVPSLTK